MQTEDKIIRTPSFNYEPDKRGLGYMLFNHMQQHRRKIAQIDGLTSEEDTYASVLQRCIRTAITMRCKGIQPGDIVTLCTFNHLNSCVPFIASFFAGAIPASLDPTLSLSDTVHLLNQVNPKMIFVTPEALQLIEEAVAQTSSSVQVIVFGNTAKYTPFSEFVKPYPEEDSFQPTQAKSLKDTAIIFFSSGTSGMPKGICISHFSLMGQIVNISTFGHCTDIILAYASFYWITSALFWGVAIYNGHSRLVLPKFDVTIAWRKIHQYKPTFMFLAPSQILEMHSEGRPKGIDTSSLQDIIVGGGPLSEEQLLKVRTIFPGTRVSLCYGQTELAGFLSCFRPANPKEVDMSKSKLGSAGVGITGVSYKVVDPISEEVLGPNQRGELRYKSIFELNGYYKIDSSDVWDADGWVKSGDIVYYDEDLCFYVVDRVKDMLKFQSWHVSPAVIEAVMLKHPLIKKAIVIGVPHEIDGDHPMAVVELENAKSVNITPKEIEKYVEERVHDRQRLRGGVKIIDSLPVTPSGKVKKGEIKKMFL